MSLAMLNRNSDQILSETLEINTRAAIALKDILKTNFGPNGKLKMLVDGAGGVTLTKDGCVLLKNMQIEHPTASIIARCASAQDDVTGDGSTSLVVFIGELMLQAFHLVNEGVHPRVLSDGIEIARKISLEFLEKFHTEIEDLNDRELLCNIARTSLRTKLTEDVAEHLTEIIVDSVKTIQKKDEPIDLYMIELMTMEHKSSLESTLIQGIVLDHGFRHPRMKKVSENCYLLTCNVSLEYEKTEVNSQFYYRTADQRSQMVKAERDHVNYKIKQIVALKENVCGGENKDKFSFVVINQKGIDPLALDLLQKNGIVALRRAKRRNMERLTKAFGGIAVNSVENLSKKNLGFAKKVFEKTLGEEKFTFVEGAKDPSSCTILLRGSNNYSLKQQKDAVRDGQRAVKAALEGKKIVAGAGAFEAACYLHLKDVEENREGLGKAVAGIRVFSQALLVLPKVLANNSGLDGADSVFKLLSEIRKNYKGKLETARVGLNLEDGSLMSPDDEGVWDNYRSKRQLLHLGAITAEKLLVVDEVIRAGKA